MILGAGASGLVCAVRCIELGLSVCILDHAREPGKKLAISGGGKANFCNRELKVDRYLGDKDFIAPVLRCFGTAQSFLLMERLGLTWEERNGGKYFLKSSASELVLALLSLCHKSKNFVLRTQRSFCAKDLSLSSSGVQLQLANENEFYIAKHLVVALGSPAFPSVGASGLGYAVAEQCGHTIVPPEPALVPLLLPTNSPLYALQGISLPVIIRTGTHEFEDQLLFTHNGLSGPAALKASLYWKSNETVTINFLPQVDVQELFSDRICRRSTSRSLLSRHMPQHLVDHLLPLSVRDRKVAELSKNSRNKILELVTAYKFIPTATSGLARAEVCRGGVQTLEVEPLTFLSLKKLHVSLVGEVLDVTGILGGYNLHWAFASGWLAAEAIYSLLGSR